MTIDDAIKLAKKEVKDCYAIAYLNKIPDAINIDGTDGFKVQILYILNNLRTWKGENARQAKKVMIEYVKH
jgi:hypothetical protein